MNFIKYSNRRLLDGVTDLVVIHIEDFAAMDFALKNNYSKPVKFKGYIISNPISHCAGIRSGNSVDGVFLEPNESNENPNYLDFDRSYLAQFHLQYHLEQE